ncbi:MAG: vWA domain-containing protein [Halieaceae bacterium]|nr:vWA domain-containing protein [Halieaceae bacterium]
MRRAGLWCLLLLLSLLVHFFLSWQAGRGLDLPGKAGAEDTVELELVVPREAPEPPDPLLFEEPPELDPPAVLVAAASETPPPPSVDLAMVAAAGGRSEALLAPPVLNTVVFTAGQGTAGFGAGIGTGLSQSSNTFAAYVQGLRETGLDVMFVVDATGSMDWAIAEVRTRIVDIVDSVRSLVPIARFGVVAYRDYDDPEFVTRIQPLTFSLAKLSTFLDTLEATGGGSWQEAVTAGMEAAMNANWRTGARRVVVIVGDAPPHEADMDRLLALARDMVTNGGQVSTLDVSNDSNPALIEASLGRRVNRSLYRNKPMLQFQAVADAGSGTAATMDGDIIVARQLLTLVMGGQFSAEMSLLLEAM